MMTLTNCIRMYGMAPPTFRQERLNASVETDATVVPNFLWHHSSPDVFSDLGSGRSSLKELTGFQEGVHDDAKLSRHSNRCSPEANPCPQFQPPCTQRTVGMSASDA
jgi:hypothetical protein